MNPIGAPIPTWYKNYWCRSRLEARWLKFLDVLGIQFNYEHEGFQFQDGTRYLPDVWFPWINVWAEIKPAELTPSENHKVNLLARLTNRPVLKLIGLPDYRLYETVLWQPDVSEYLPGLHSSLDIEWRPKVYLQQRRLWTEQEPLPILTAEDYSNKYLSALSAAMSARFELH